MIGHCGDCKYWGTDEDRRDDKSCRNCRRIGDIGPKTINDNAIVTAPDSPLLAVLNTRASFGCVLFEARPTA